MKNIFNFELKGFKLDANKSNLPKYTGIYFVYRCTYNREKNTVELHELLYIGETNDKQGIKGRINGHEKREEWLEYLEEDETLCYSYVSVESQRMRVEAAYIFKHQPPVNEDLKEHFSYPATHIVSTGKVGLIKKDFTVHPTIDLSKNNFF